MTKVHILNLLQSYYLLNEGLTVFFQNADKEMKFNHQKKKHT